jgi:hypothetical protein
LQERFHNVLKLWGLNKWKYLQHFLVCFWCYSCCICDNKTRKGGQMKPQDVYKLEQVLRLSISQDLLNKASNFHNRDDMEEARKIVEKKH